MEGGSHDGCIYGFAHLTGMGDNLIWAAYFDLLYHVVDSLRTLVLYYILVKWVIST